MTVNQTEKNLSTKVSQTALWTALVTPFDQNGEIDFASLSKAAIAQADAGNGILLLGSTGEGLALSLSEQRAIVKHVCELKLSAPIMVAVGGFNLQAQLDWVAECNQLPIDAYLLGTPIYAKPGPVGQTHWFTQLLDAAKAPCMLYNVPSRSGVEVSLLSMKTLQHHQNCWAMKEASGDLNKFLAYRAQCPELALFSGEDAMLPYLASAGAQGLVSVCSNAWPQATHRYVSLSLAGNTQGLFPLWQQAVDALFQVANPIPVKVLMYQQGIIANQTLRAPLTHLELAANNGLAEADNTINQWFSAQNIAQAAV